MTPLERAAECETNYGEVMADNGEEAIVWCVPDAVAEGCLDVSSELDCSERSALECDDAMGQMFWACIQLQYAGGAR